MSNVISMECEAPERVPHHRLLRLSRALALFFTVLLGAYTLLVIALMGVGLFFPNHVVMGTRGMSVSFEHNPALYPGAIRLTALSWFTRLVGAITIVIDTSPIFFVFWHLRGLFALYAAGTVFGQKNAAHLKHIGLWLIAYPAAIFAGNTLFLLAGGADHRSWFRLSELQAPILGLIVLAIAQVMEFGRDIELEKDSFI